MPAALILISALLYYFSFPNFVFVKGAPFLAWGCALPFFYVLEGRFAGQRLWAGLAWGLLANGMLVSWLFPLSPGGWFLFVVVLAVQPVIVALFYPSAALHPVLRFLLIPSVWAASEWVRAWLLGGFVWGLGYSQAGIAVMIQPAAFGGVYAVTWVIVAANAAFYIGMGSSGRCRCRLWRGVVPGVVLCIAGVAAGVMPRIPSVMTPGCRRVAAVQPDIGYSEKTREDLYDVHAARHLALTRQVVTAAGLGAGDLVVWPETAFPDDIRTDLQWRPQLERTARELGVNLLIGSALLRQGKDFNSAILLFSDGGWGSVYDKVHLVPLCESTPAALEGMSHLLRVGRYHFSPGSRPGLMRLPGGVFLGVAICSEEFYPDMFRRMSQEGASFAVVMLNDGWFIRREALLLHALAAPLRAVESGLPLVRAANTGRTCAFDGLGRPLGLPLELQQPGAAAYALPLGAGITFYARWGDVFAMGCVLFVIIFFMFTHCQSIRPGERHVVS